MSRFTTPTLFLLVCAIFGLASCSGRAPTTDPSLAFTQIWQTVEVAQAQTAQASSSTPSLTKTPAVSATPQSTKTPLLTNTLLPGVPSSTPFSISTSTSAVTRSAACDNANFVKDVTIPDGAEVPAGQPVIKTWSFKNLGPCPWSTSYRLVFSYMSDSGKNGVLKAPAPVDFPNAVLPGESMEISVTFNAPTKAGTYQLVFVLQNSNGFSIPLINYNTYEFWVNFVVK